MILTETTAELRAMANDKQVWLVSAGAGVIIGLTGPFGTYDALSLPLRCAYWVVVVITTFWIGYAVSFAVVIWSETRRIGTIASLVLGSVIASVPIALWLATLHAAVFAAPFWTEVLRLYPYVVVIVLAVAFMSEAFELRQTDTTQTTAPNPEPAWLDQLPPHLGRDLLLLQAQDHYVRAETALGDTLIRAQLQDVAEELGSYGVRLHRSWWVARSAIRSLSYHKGALVAILEDGRAIPVGRTYRRTVREAIG